MGANSGGGGESSGEEDESKVVETDERRIVSGDGNVVMLESKRSRIRQKEAQYCSFGASLGWPWCNFPRATSTFFLACLIQSLGESSGG